MNTQNKKNRIFKAFTILLSMILTISIVPAGVSLAETVKVPSGFTEVCENDSYILSYNEETTHVAVTDKKTGTSFFTNPQGADSDTLASPVYQKLMKSTLNVTYYNEQVQSKSMDNFSYSIMDGLFETENNGNILTVTYSIGEGMVKLTLPSVIEETKFLELLDKIDASEAKKVKRNYLLVTKENATDEQFDLYPNLTEKNFYTLRSGVKDYLKEEMAEYFAKVGVTTDMVEEYRIEAGGEEVGSKKPWFIIPLHYELLEDGLRVSVDPDEITYNEEGYYLVNIDILPYFNASSSDNGYLFVPDGCGALIHNNNGKTTVNVYYGDVYGYDDTKRLMSEKKPETEETYAIKLPVFGAKTDDSAWLGIIEEGSGYAGIYADVSGKTTSYNKVYPSFSFLQYGPASLGDMVGGANSYQLYSLKDFSSKYSVKYCFLEGDDANYSGMARTYRKYLIDNGQLTAESESGKTPFFTELLGGFNKYDTFLGIKYSAILPLTTYSQAIEILDALKDKGVDTPTVIYSGWANGGIHGTAGVKIKEESILNKNKLNTKKFVAELEKRGISSYFTVEMQKVYKDKAFDGYTSLQLSPGYFDHTEIKLYDYWVSNGAKSNVLCKLISPAFATKCESAVLKAIKNYTLPGINIGSVSSKLYSDLVENRYTDREKAKGIYTETVTAIADRANVLSDNSNDYMLYCTKDMINAPLYSNRTLLLDEEVPFYEMVIHGSINYAGEALNLADDYETTLLRSVEYGAGLYFKFIYEDNSVLKDTDYEYDELYSVNYKAWLEKAGDDYKKVSSVLGDLANVPMVSHNKTDNVSVTVYANGTNVYVNYNKYPVNINGIRVEAKSFNVRRESK